MSPRRERDPELIARVRRVEEGKLNAMEVSPARRVLPMN